MAKETKFGTFIQGCRLPAKTRQTARCRRTAGTRSLGRNGRPGTSTWPADSQSGQFDDDRSRSDDGDCTLGRWRAGQQRRFGHGMSGCGAAVFRLDGLAAERTGTPSFRARRNARGAENGTEAVVGRRSAIGRRRELSRRSGQRPLDRTEPRG